MLKGFENEKKENLSLHCENDKTGNHHRRGRCTLASSPRLYGGVSNSHCQTSQKGDDIKEGDKKSPPSNEGNLNLLELNNSSTTKKLQNFEIIQKLENIESLRRNNKDYQEKSSEQEIENDENFHSNKPLVASSSENDGLYHQQPPFQNTITKSSSLKGKEKNLQNDLISKLTNVASTSTETSSRNILDDNHNENYKGNNCNDSQKSSKQSKSSPKNNLCCWIKSQSNISTKKQEEIQVENKPLENVSSSLTKNQVKEIKNACLNTSKNNNKIQCPNCLGYKKTNSSNELNTPSSSINKGNKSDCSSWTSCWNLSPRALRNTHISRNENSNNKCPSNEESSQSSPSPNDHQSYILDNFFSKPQNYCCWNLEKKETEQIIEDKVLRLSLESGSSTSEDEKNLKIEANQIGKENISIPSKNNNLKNQIQNYNLNNSDNDENMEIFKEVIILEVEEQPKNGYHLTSINTTQYDNSVRIEVVVIKDNDIRSDSLLSQNAITIDSSLENNEDIDRHLNNESANNFLKKIVLDAPPHHDSTTSNILEDLTHEESMPSNGMDEPKNINSCKNEDLFATSIKKENQNELKPTTDKCSCWRGDSPKNDSQDAVNIKNTIFFDKSIYLTKTFVDEDNTMSINENQMTSVDENKTKFINENKTRIVDENTSRFIDENTSTSVDEELFVSMDEKKLNGKKESYKCWNVCILDEKTKISNKEENNNNKLLKDEKDDFKNDEIISSSVIKNVKSKEENTKISSKHIYNCTSNNTINSNVKKNLTQGCNCLPNISGKLDIERKNDDFVSTSDAKRYIDILNKQNNLTTFVGDNHGDEIENLKTEKKSTQNCSYRLSSVQNGGQLNDLSIGKKNNDYKYNDVVCEDDKSNSIESEVSSSNSTYYPNCKLEDIKILNDNKRPNQGCTSCWSSSKTKKISNESIDIVEGNSIEIDDVIENKAKLLKKIDISTSSHQPCEHCELINDKDKNNTKIKSMISSDLSKFKKIVSIEIGDSIKDKRIDSKDLDVSASLSKHAQNNKGDDSFDPMASKNLTKEYDCWPFKKIGTSNDSLRKKKGDCDKLNEFRNKEQDTKDLEILNSYSQFVNYSQVKKVDTHCGRCINTLRKEKSHTNEVFEKSSHYNFLKKSQILNNKEDSSKEINMDHQSHETTLPKESQILDSHKNQDNDIGGIISNEEEVKTLIKTLEMHEIQQIQETQETQKIQEIQETRKMQEIQKTPQYCLPSFIDEEIESNQHKKLNHDESIEESIKQKNKEDILATNQIKEESFENSKNFDDAIVNSNEGDKGLKKKEIREIDNDEKNMEILKNKIEVIEIQEKNITLMANKSHQSSVVTNSCIDVNNKSDEYVEVIDYSSKKHCWNCTSNQLPSTKSTKLLSHKDTKQLMSKITKDIKLFDDNQSLSLESLKNKPSNNCKTLKANDEKNNEGFFGRKCWSIFSPHFIKEAIKEAWIGRFSKSTSPTPISSPKKSSFLKENKKNCQIDEVVESDDKNYFNNALFCYNLSPRNSKNHKNKSKTAHDISQQKLKEIESFTIKSSFSLNIPKDQYIQGSASNDTQLKTSKNDLEKNISIACSNDRMKSNLSSMLDLKSKNHSFLTCLPNNSMSNSTSLEDGLQYKLEKSNSNRYTTNESQSSENKKTSYVYNEMSKKEDFDKSLKLSNSHVLKEREKLKIKGLKPTKCMCLPTSPSNNIMPLQHLDITENNDTNIDLKNSPNLLASNDDKLEEDSKQSSASNISNVSKDTKNEGSMSKRCECLSTLPFIKIYTSQIGLPKKNSNIKSNALATKDLDFSHESIVFQNDIEKIDPKTSIRLLNTNKNSNANKNEKLDKVDSSDICQDIEHKKTHKIKLKDNKSSKSSCWSLLSCNVTNTNGITPHEEVVKESTSNNTNINDNVDMHLIQTNLEKFETDVFSNDLERIKNKETEEIKVKEIKSKNKFFWPSFNYTNMCISQPESLCKKTKASKVLISNDEDFHEIDNLEISKSNLENIELEVFTTNLEKNKLKNSKKLNSKTLKNNTCWSSLPCNNTIIQEKHSKKLNDKCIDNSIKNGIQNDELIDEAKEVLTNNENSTHEYDKEILNTKSQYINITKINEKGQLFISSNLYVLNKYLNIFDNIK